MKKVLNVLALVPLLLLCSCDRKIKQFVHDFSTAVANNDRAAILSMYPDAVNADSILVFDTNQLEIKKTDSYWKILMPEGKDMTIVKDKNNGSLQIKKSHGLFFYPKEQMNMALKTGWIKKNMTDGEIAEQFRDTCFLPYLSKDFMEFSKIVIIDGVVDNRASYATALTAGGEWEITVRNSSDTDVAGSDYSVVLTSRVQSKREVVIEGKDVFSETSVVLKSPHISVSFYYNENRGLWKEPSVDVRFNLSAEEMLYKYYQPQGNEYKLYLQFNNNVQL